MSIEPQLIKKAGPRVAPAGVTNRLSKKRAFAIGLIVGVAALAAAIVAHLHGRPVTAALLAVFGVTAVGAISGLRAGLVAGVAASVTYNLLLTDPFLRFGVASADDLVPIIALNVSAIASGLIAGRLHDRAVAAERSNQRVAELLAFSQDLQLAYSPEQIEAVLQSYLRDRTGVQIFLVRGGELWSASEPASWGAKEMWFSGMRELGFGSSVALLLETSERRIGVVILGCSCQEPDAERARLFLPLIALAVQRCQLAAEVAEADLLRQSEKFKTAILSSVSHDLRTPLAAIAASASSLVSSETNLDEATKRDLLATIQEQSERLDRVTTNLLNLGRIEGGLSVSQMPVIDAVEVLGSALARTRRLHPDHRFDREFRVESANVRADEALLEQVFLNLLENAAVHTPKGTLVKVAASLANSDLAVSIEDDGPGIAEADWDRIFERFYRGLGEKRQPGSGLGLSISKGFAELIGGTIRACHAHPPMRGARIEVTLPLAT